MLTSRAPRFALAAILSLIFQTTSSTPAPTPIPDRFEQIIRDVPLPRITPPPRKHRPTRTHDRRDDPLTSILSAVETDIDSILSEIGSNLPTWAASGILPGFQSFPTGTAVQSSLSLADADVATLPTQVLNLPSYANWTEQGWNLRLHGNVYKIPNITESKLDDLADIFLGNTSIDSLPASQQAQARNLTAEIFVIQQANVQPLFSFVPTSTTGTQAVQTLLSPYNTTDEGDYDAFSLISMDGLVAGNATTKIQEVPMYVDGTTSGNATAYLVPPTGITVVSDIDDILRVTKIYEPEQGLLNSFARPFTPYANMPSIYANWSKTVDGIHFAYLTTTPEQITRNYMSFIYANYPAGSFDTRPLNFSDISATLHVRLYLLQKLFDTFPNRKFVLVGDTSNSDIMTDYPTLAQITNQVACILLRNTSATDPGDRFPYDTSGFKGLAQSSYMFFVTPDDLTGLDLSRGDCYNASVPQNVTFGWMNLPGGATTSSSNSSSSGTTGAAPGWRVDMARTWTLLVVAGLVAIIASAL